MVEENLEKFHWTPLECTGRDSKRVNIESILTLEGLRNGKREWKLFCVCI
jgi:hypothetical protein